jgi:uncharacterized protein YukE
MSDGKLRMNPAEARSKAQYMIQIASQIEELLNSASKKMNEIGSLDAGVYHSMKAQQLRAELNSFAHTFHSVHEQIVKSAQDIITIADIKERE